MSLRFVLVILAVICAVAFAHKYDDVKRLQVGVKYRPDDCTIKVQDGDSIDVHYAGRTTDGNEFDSSIKRNQPFTFRIGQGSVIRGWDTGLLGACEGEKRKLVIPSDMGYGPSGSPPKVC